MWHEAVWIVLYSHHHNKHAYIYIYIYIYIHVHAEYILMQWIRRAKTSLKNIPLTLFERFERLLMVLLWEGVGDRTELQHIDPHSYGHQRCVFLVLQGPNSLLDDDFLYRFLSLTHLISNSLTPCLTELYNSSIAHSIFGMACLIVIKRK